MRHRAVIPKLLLFSAAGFIAAFAVIGTASPSVSGGLWICGGVLLALAGGAGVAELYAPSEMPTRYVRIVGRATVGLGVFFVLAGIAVLLTEP